MFFNSDKLLDYRIEYIHQGKTCNVIIKATDKKDALRKLAVDVGCNIVVNHVGPVLCCERRDEDVRDTKN